MKLNFAIILLIAVVAAGCNGSKAFAKRAQQLEEAGLVQEAANNYYIALQKKRTNVEAQIGMKTTGQLVLNEKLNEFAKAKNFGNKKDAVYAYHRAEDYQKKIRGVGITLNMAEFYKTDYDLVLESYLHDLYEEGSTLLEAEDFNKAETIFEEIGRLDPEFKDAEELKDIAYLEPHYNDGVNALANGLYREAYNSFDKVIARRAGYKDAKDLRTECVEKGRFSVAIMPFENSTRTQGLDSKISAYTLDALAAIDDPFLRVVDRDHLETILAEQKLSLTGVIDEATAVNVGDLIGAQALITGTVLTYETTAGRPQSYTRQAYEQYKVKKYNKEEDKYYYDTKYKSTTYREHSQSSSAEVSFQFKVISLQTGEVLASKILNKTAMDQVNYATYDGEHDKLYPAKNSGVNLNRSARSSLVSQLNARRELRPVSELKNDLFDQVSRELKTEISALLEDTIK